MKLKGYSINIDNKNIPVLGFLESVGTIYMITSKRSLKSFSFRVKDIQYLDKVMFDKKEYDIIHLINMSLLDFEMNNALTKQFNKFKNEIKKL